MAAWGSLRKCLLYPQRAATPVKDTSIAGLTDACDVDDSDGMMDTLSTPTVIEMPEDQDPAFISCGTEHAALITETGLLFTWGAGAE